MKRAVSLSRMLAILCIFFVASSAQSLAKSNPIPEPFRGQDKQSTLSISYSDYSEILKYSVLDMGKSNRAKAPKTSAKIGSRFKAKRKTYTALEGNRFLFENFKNEKNRSIITNIRKSLERVPDEVPMSLLNAKEQLAFWLNLYNITLIEQLSLVYPQKNLEQVLYDNDGIMEKKVLKVSGIKLSLNDIQDKIILGKFSANPIVIYGLFQGTIGGPNIRTSAYTGKLVIKQLRQNAREFINSNRGTFRGKKNSLRVSSFYDRNRQFFSDFKKDLKQHLSYYIDNNYAGIVKNADRIRPDIENMNIVDIMGGQREFSSSAATNEAAFLASAGTPEVTGRQVHFDGEVMTSEPIFNNRPGGGAGSAGIMHPSGSLADESVNTLVRSYGRFSPQQMEILKSLHKNRKQRSGVVTISEDEEQVESDK